MAVHIHGRLIPDPLQHAIDGDEAAGAAHAGRAVGHHGAGVGGVQGLDAPQEQQERGRVVRHAVVRPGRELELTHFATFQRVRLMGRGGGIVSDTLTHMTSLLRESFYSYWTSQTTTMIE